MSRLTAAEAEKAKMVLGLSNPPKARTQAQAAAAGPSIDLDPELKEKLKSARQWLNDTAPTLPAGLQFEPAAVPHQDNHEVSSRAGSGQTVTTGANAATRDGPAGTHREVSPGHGGPANTTAAVFDLALEVATHPGVLTVLGLLLAGKLMMATLRFNVARQDARLRRQARQQGVASVAPSGHDSGHGRSGSSRERPRQRSRHRREA